jgi:sarcosine oxidase, subunit beta
MPISLLYRGLHGSLARQRWLPSTPDKLRPTYDVVIIGGGGHGLAIAHYLAANHGIHNVAVIEKGYLGGGNTARNTAIVRANYLTPEGVRFYRRSVELFRGLSRDLGLNIMYSERGHLTLAHTDAAVRVARWRAEVNKALDVDSEFVSPDDLEKLCPPLNLSSDVRYPILGALYHPPGAIARHDALAWSYAAGAAKHGVEIHQGTTVTGLKVAGNHVTTIETDRGAINCGVVVQAVAGSSSLIAAMAGLRLPIRTIPLQACVSQPLKPFLDPIVVSGSLHVYVSQSARGELVMGGAVDPYALYAQRSTLDFMERTIADLLELFPAFAQARVMRQWAGIADMTPDFSPVMGPTPIENHYIDAGWGTWGFKATPVVGETMAEMVATGRVPKLIAPFTLERFTRLEQIGERAAASVGH